MKKLFFVISVIFCLLAHGQERIESTRFDRSKVMLLYLAPGLGSIVLFPCALQEVFIGRSDDLKAQISPNDKKTLFLNLKLNTSLPTNLIAKCEGDKTVLVFDVIPSRTKHQDVVEIRNFFGSPKGTVAKSVQPEKQSVFVVKAPILMEKGAGR